MKFFKQHNSFHIGIQVLSLFIGLIIPSFSFSNSNLYLTEQPTAKRSLILSPAISFFLPGFGQALNGQYKKTSAMVGYYLAGWELEKYSKQRIEDFNNSDSLNFHHLLDLHRYEETGASMQFKVGFLSAYDAFANNVADYQAEGKYNFLPREQNIYTVMKAPFEFSYLKRWTTYVPLLIGLAASDLELNKYGRPSKYDARLVDVSASSIRSYNAGVGEEVVFRGWLMPVLYENTEIFWLSNFIQGTAFGYSHGPRPYFQLAAGYYAGWLTEKNEWDMGEAIFLHTWWDVLVLAAEVIRSRSFTRDYSVPLSIAFSF